MSLAGGILGTSLRAPGARVFHGICGYCSKKEKISFQTKITGHTGSLEAAALCHSPRDLCKQGAGLQRRETGIAHAAPWQGAGSHAECCLSSLAQPCGEWRALSAAALGASFHESFSLTTRWVCVGGRSGRSALRCVAQSCMAGRCVLEGHLSFSLLTNDPPRGFALPCRRVADTSA